MSQFWLQTEARPPRVNQKHMIKFAYQNRWQDFKTKQAGQLSVTLGARAVQKAFERQAQHADVLPQLSGLAAANFQVLPHN